VALDEQADALGLCRSTTWTILQATHKNSGLSATVVNRMLASPQLPAPVRAKLIEYIEEKISGRYGHGKVQLREFAGRLTPPLNVVTFREARQRAGGNRAVFGARGHASFGQEQRCALTACAVSDFDSDPLGAAALRSVGGAA
jgi:hypothetical protein